MQLKKIKMEGVMKKIMSCVVALAFIMSVGLNVGFASVDQTSSSSGFTLPIVNDGGMNTGNVNKDPQISGTISRITAVFNYNAGQLISIGGADRGVTLISNGKALASLSYNLDGTYTIASLNLDGLDYAKVEKAGGLKNFLLALGISEKALQAQPTVFDSKGNPVNITADTDPAKIKELTGYDSFEAYASRPATDVAWLSLAEKTLSSGINHGISINFGASGGASLTVLENGRPQASYAATLDAKGNLFKTADYNYVNGFLDSVTSYSYEIDYLGSDPENGAKAQAYKDEETKWLAENPGKKEADFADQYKNSENKAAYEKIMKNNNVQYKIAATVTKYDAYGRAAHVSKDGQTTVEYKYGINGSLLSSYDARTEMTTNYVNGQASQVKNNKGYLVNQYNYNPNGTLNNVTSYNNNTAVTITAFKFNKELATANLSNGYISADGIRAAYAQLTDPNTKPGDYAKIIADNHLTDVQAYAEHLKNENFIKFLIDAGGKKDGTADLALKVMQNNYNGLGPIASASFVFGQKDTYSVDGKTSLSLEEVKQRMYDTMSASQRASQLKDADGKAIVDSNGNFLEGKGVNDISIEQSASKDKQYHNITQNSTGILTVNTTVNSYGASAFSLESECNTGVKETKSLGGYSDPAVVGVVNEFVDANGQTIGDINAYIEQNPNVKVFAKVDPKGEDNGINMMDGSGHFFQPVKGEMIFIEITSDMASELSIGDRAMFMGDVAPNEFGEWQMRSNEEYSITVKGTTYNGFVAGKDLKDAITEVQSESVKAMNGESKYAWMNTNTSDNRSIFQLGVTSYLNDWRIGWDKLLNK